MPKTKPYKAIAAFILTFGGLVGTALAGDADGVVTGMEWLIIILGSGATTGAVYGITNTPVHRNDPPVV